MGERVKNLSLVVLCAMMCFLMFVNMALATDAPQLAFVRQMMGISYTKSEAGDADTSIPLSIMPQKIAIKNLQGLFWAVEEEDYHELVSMSNPILSEALGTAGTPYPISKEQFLELFSGCGIYASFDLAAPPYLLEQWLATETALPIGTDTLFACAKGEEVVLAIFDGQTYYVCETSAGYDRLMALCTQFESVNSIFAFEDSYFANLLELEPVLTKSTSLTTYQVGFPDFVKAGELPEEVLTAFSVNSYLTKVYKTSAGDIVYVEGYVALQLSQNGTLAYSAPADSGLALGISADMEDGEYEQELVKKTQKLLQTIQRSVGNSLPFSLGEVKREGERYILGFEEHLGSCFVTAPGGYSAIFVIEEGRVVSISLSLASYSPADKTTLLPFRLAAVLMEGAANRFSIRYEHSQGGTLFPVICYYEGRRDNGVE